MSSARATSAIGIDGPSTSALLKESIRPKLSNLPTTIETACEQEAPAIKDNMLIPRVFDAALIDNGRKGSLKRAANDAVKTTVVEYGVLPT